MSTEKFGFVYIWRDRKHNRYYVGCHWGTYEDGYICSSRWMRKTQRRRPQDFKRRILKTNLSRQEMYVEEQRYLNMIKPEERKIRYYNLTLYSKKPWHQYDDQVKTIGEKISASKTGKSITFKDPTERARKISEAKKGKKHPIGSKTGRARKPHTEEWKAANSARMKMQWTNGARSKEDASLRMRGNEHAKR